MRYHHWWLRDYEGQAMMHRMFEIMGYKQLRIKKSSPLQKMRTGYLSLLIPILGLF